MRWLSVIVQPDDAGTADVPELIEARLTRMLWFEEPGDLKVLDVGARVAWE